MRKILEGEHVAGAEPMAPLVNLGPEADDR